MDTMETTQNSNVRVGCMVGNADSPNSGVYRTVHDDQHSAYDLCPGDFLVVSYHGYHTIARLTGRTRRIWGIACPTIERFEIETYATNEGVIRGRKAERISGMSFTRPENVDRSYNRDLQDYSGRHGL